MPRRQQTDLAFDAAKEIFGVETDEQLHPLIHELIWNHPPSKRAGLTQAMRLIASTAVQDAKQAMVDDAL